MPRIQVILRKAFGGAYIVMDSNSIGSDLAFACFFDSVAFHPAAPVPGDDHGDLLKTAESFLGGVRLWDARTITVRVP